MKKSEKFLGLIALLMVIGSLFVGVVSAEDIMSLYPCSGDTRSFCASTAETYSVKGDVERVSNETDTIGNRKAGKVSVSPTPTPAPVTRYRTDGETYTFVTMWPNQYWHLRYPEGIAVDSSGYVYVTDFDIHRIQKFAPGIPEEPLLCTDPDPPSHDFGTVPGGQTREWTFDINNCGDDTLTWTVSDDQSWITVTPTSGSTTTETDTVTVTIETTGLECDIPHNGIITVSSNGGSKQGTITVYVPDQPVHNLNTDEYFSTIQAAISDSDTADGHTITVDP